MEASEKEPDQEDEFPKDQDVASRLKALGASVREQSDIQHAVELKADQMLLEQADERDNKRLEKTYRQKQTLESQLRKQKEKLRANPSSLRTRSEINQTQSELDQVDRDLEQIQQRIEDRHKDAEDPEETSNADASGSRRRTGESKRDYLIRTGKITPFSKFGLNNIKTSSDLAEVMIDAEENDTDDHGEDELILNVAEQAGPTSHVDLLKPGFVEDYSSEPGSAPEPAKTHSKKKRKLSQGMLSDGASSRSLGVTSESEEGEDSFTVQEERTVISGSRQSSKTKRLHGNVTIDMEDLTSIDDGNERVYQTRLERWVEGRKAARAKAEKRSDVGEKSGDLQRGGYSEDTQDVMTPNDQQEQHEWHLPHPTRPDAELAGQFRIPGDVYPSLFDYQKTGVQWLWELYQQQVGGIVGDEMGLGKTIQVIAFLAGLHYSRKYAGPIIIVCPATVMKQWVNEFHTWWPPFRVSILHTSGSGMLDVKRESRIDDDLDFNRTTESKRRSKTTNKAAKRIVDRVVSEGHVLVTTYSGLQSHADLLIPVEWGYAVLDEGHKIRNPNTAITIFCKELRTHNRIITSGTPIQNNLTELWSLFDFVFPMRLGNLVHFRSQFEMPIKQGGYANASNLQVETAFNCAQALKEAISPYLLQRWKSDVAADLPTKTEQVLFCQLTKSQMEFYRRFIHSTEKDAITAGKLNALYGIDILRKICNHPDLTDHKVLSNKAGYLYGDPSKSGKMKVVKTLLQMWKDGGHKTLLFAQHRIMLDILEKFIKILPGMNYLRMDGGTPVKQRQDMIDDFNKDSTLHVFLLTTKVGGLGINLTSADRVIIFDPDWNPSTDLQARERAWRLGQKREVQIFRLMTAGTIEEKIYHRQLFKQFLTNKILKDAKLRQTFHLQGLEDLFTLTDPQMDGPETETGQLFKGSETRLSPPHIEEPSQNTKTNDLTNPSANPTEETRISAIDGLSHAETFKETTPTDDHTHEESNASGPPQNHLLSSLLSQSGVSSTFNHDAILSSGSKPSPYLDANGKIVADPQHIRREAKRIAAEAAKALKRSSEEAKNVPVGTVTWTGTYGESGRPGTESPAPFASGRGGGVAGRGGFSSRGGRAGVPSSSSVLSNLAARQSQQATEDNAGTSGQRSDRMPQGGEFLGMIRDYLKAHGGRAYTQMLINQFNRFCTTERRTAEFKEMLKKIAYLDKDVVRGRGGRGGRGQWVLKDEFKD